MRKQSVLLVIGLISAVLMLSACSGQQSALDPAGQDADALFRLFLFMATGAVIVWALLIGTAVVAVLRDPDRQTARAANALIIGGGIVFPTVGLAILLTYGLAALPDERAEAAVRVHVHGEQFWWRVEYEVGGTRVVSANELRLPAGEPVEFLLTTGDVIHSFWIPAIGGKMDMIPGRINRLVLEPTRPGVFRGQCAEFCGDSHALMAFAVEVLPAEEFASWLAAEAEPVTAQGQGVELFLSNGCAACHRIRGVAELGQVGPDLTHFGNRRTLAAGTAPVTIDSVARWIANPDAMKPGARMPAYDMLPAEDILAMAEFLVALE